MSLGYIAAALVDRLTQEAVCIDPAGNGRGEVDFVRRTLKRLGMYVCNLRSF